MSLLFRLALVLGLSLTSSSAFAERKHRTSTTLDTAGPIVIDALLNTYSEFLEHQVAVHDHLS